jgi:hypothetical protein
MNARVASSAWPCRGTHPDQPGGTSNRRTRVTCLWASMPRPPAGRRERRAAPRGRLGAHKARTCSTGSWLAVGVCARGRGLDVQHQISAPNSPSACRACCAGASGDFSGRGANKGKELTVAGQALRGTASPPPPPGMRLVVGALGSQPSVPQGWRGRRGRGPVSSHAHERVSPRPPHHAPGVAGATRLRARSCCPGAPARAPTNSMASIMSASQGGGGY